MDSSKASSSEWFPLFPSAFLRARSIHVRTSRKVPSFTLDLRKSGLIYQYNTSGIDVLNWGNWCLFSKNLFLLGFSQFRTDREGRLYKSTLKEIKNGIPLLLFISNDKIHSIWKWELKEKVKSREHSETQCHHFINYFPFFPKSFRILITLKLMLSRSFPNCGKCLNN